MWTFLFLELTHPPFGLFPLFVTFFFFFFFFFWGGGVSLKQVLRPIVLCHRENVALPKNWIEFYPLSNAAIRFSLATLFDTIRHSAKLVEGPPPPPKKKNVSKKLEESKRGMDQC